MRSGCHGVNFGPKTVDGYYAYVSSTFSNEVIVVDDDPNNDANSKDASITGRLSLVASSTTVIDDDVVDLAGQKIKEYLQFLMCIMDSFKIFRLSGKNCSLIAKGSISR